MKAPDRNCMYCNQLMEYAEDCGTYYIYVCKSGCKHQENVDSETGKIIYYNFRVGPYWLKFSPKHNCFFLGKDPPDDIGNTENILTFNFLPTHLTPQNTTEERIKLLLLFS
jgi:hypothetical protein